MLDLLYTMKAIVGKKTITISAYIKKSEKSQIT